MNVKNIFNITKYQLNSYKHASKQVSYEDVEAASHSTGTAWGGTVIMDFNDCGGRLNSYCFSQITYVLAVILLHYTYQVRCTLV